MLLYDPTLALAAEILDDLERVTIANQNRLRQLTRSTEDKDGEVRGFGLDETHPDVARLAAIVEALGKSKDDAGKNLDRVLRRHPLGPWVKAQKGIGERQAARLLAAIGDPYWRPEIVKADGEVVLEGPRTVSALWAYAGYHVLPAGQTLPDTQHSSASRTDLPATGHMKVDSDPASLGAHISSVGVAPVRRRNQKANWSSTAKMRAYLIAESCMKCLRKPCAVDPDLGYAIHTHDCDCSPYRITYDTGRAKYADAKHDLECVRCGPKGKPAPPGTPLSDAHKLARALRLVSKQILRDLWVEAKRIHDERSEP